MLWWLARGIAGTPMPGVRDSVTEDQLWDVLNFLRVLANADMARRLNTSVDPWRSVTAPDFVFQIGRGPQESLAQERGRNIVLLVLYSHPHSLARLRALTDYKGRFHRLGVRVVAVPMDEANAVSQDARGVDAAMLAEADASLVATYKMLTRTIVDDTSSATHHVEFLVDRQGYVRSRWIPAKEPAWDAMSELLRQAVALNREKPRPPAPARHMH
jgi:putative copper resistance protein D